MDAGLLEAFRSARAAHRSWSEIGAMLSVLKQDSRPPNARTHNTPPHESMFGRGAQDGAIFRQQAGGPPSDSGGFQSPTNGPDRMHSLRRLLSSAVGAKGTSPAVLRWAGSKRRQVPALLDLAPTAFDRYVEPFAGSAVLFFGLRPKAAVLGDTNESLMSYYRWVRKAPKAVHQYAAEAEAADDYYGSRAAFNRLKNGAPKAGLFLYLNNRCFNGLYRENTRGEFNVPVGTRARALPSLDEIQLTSVVLQAAELRQGPFTRTLTDAHEGDFVYLDPPFFSARHHESGEFGRQTFRAADFPALFRECNRLTALGARCMLTLPDSARPVFTQKWKRTEHPVVYHLAGNRKEQSGVEYVWRNY